MSLVKVPYLLLRQWLRDVRERAFLDIGIRKLLILWRGDLYLLIHFSVLEIDLEEKGLPAGHHTLKKKVTL